MIKGNKMKLVLRLVASLLLLTVAACTTINRSLVTEYADNALVSELMAPIYQGQQNLINNLGSTPHDVIVFRIQNQNVVPTSKASFKPQIWSPQQITFFRLKEAGSAPKLYYFDNHNAHFYPVNKSKAGSFLLFRSLPRKESVLARNQNLDLVGLQFNYNAQGEINYSGKMKVAGLPGTPYLPVYLRNRGLVFFLSRQKNGTLKLFSVDQNGRNLRQHLQQGAGNIARIFTDDGNSLIFESDRKGYQSLFKLDIDRHLITDYARSNNKDAWQNKYILSNRFVSGTAVPAVVKLPETLDINNITSLVVAQNPQINLKRSLYAATLVKVGMATLPNNPYINFEIGSASSTGLFVDKRGFLTRTVANGLVGLIQPVLDIKRNKELAEAAAFTAKISKNQLENEINERVAEALQLYFKLLYLKEINTSWDSLITEYNKRLAFYTNLRRSGDTNRREILGAKRILVAGISEQQHNKRQIQFLKSRLKQLCGLPHQAPILLKNEQFDMDRIDVGNEKVLHDLALLNHPRLKVVLNEMKRAYFLEAAGPDVRRQLNVNADYEYLGNSTNNALTDNINLGISGRISTAQAKSDRLHRNYWKQIKDSLRIKLGVKSDEINLQLDESIKDFKASKNDYLAKKADVAYYLEKLRVARLYQNIEPLDERDRGDPLAVSTAVQEYLLSLTRLAKVKNDLGIRYVNIWRETGRAQQLPQQLKHFTVNSVRKYKASLWLWRTKQIIASPESRAAFIELAKTNNVRRVYAYLYSDSRLLANPLDRERFTLFINACRKAGVQVWGLLGEPEWLTNRNGSSDLSRAIGRIQEFNQSKNPREPMIAGLKIDLEPHSFKGWDNNPRIKNDLNNAYLQLLSIAKHNLGGKIPLWVDAPVKYFTKQENKRLLNAIFQLTEGVTAMVYFNNPKTITKVAEKVLQHRQGPIEIGVEFSGKAPMTDTLYPLRASDLPNTLNTIASQLRGWSNYAGLSLHDYSALSAIMGDN